MTNWSAYGLKDIPFLAVPAIKITSEDKRSNGQLYYSKFAQKEIVQMTKMIRMDAFPWIFLLTEGETLGNGKSAFLAHIYHNLENEGKNVLWAYARDDPRLTHLLSEILDSYISEGKLSALKKVVGAISPQEIEQRLKKSLIRYGSKTIHALNRLLSVNDEELVYTFTIIKRTNPTLNHGELFGALLHLSYACGESRFTIFIDQFEEYVLAHTTTEQKIKLGNEINDLLREIGETTTFVVSTHPKVTNEILASSPEADTFTKVQNASVRLPLMSSSDLLQMVITYLQAFRLDGYRGDACFPFPEEIVLYAAERTELNPRNLILALRSAMLYGALADFATIDEDFLLRNHSRIFGGLEDKWKDFKQGNWHHQIE